MAFQIDLKNRKSSVRGFGVLGFCLFVCFLFCFVFFFQPKLKETPSRIQGMKFIPDDCDKWCRPPLPPHELLNVDVDRPGKESLLECISPPLRAIKSNV